MIFGSSWGCLQEAVIQEFLQKKNAEKLKAHVEIN